MRTVLRDEVQRRITAARAEAADALRRCEEAVTAHEAIEFRRGQLEQSFIYPDPHRWAYLLGIGIGIGIGSVEAPPAAAEAA